MLLCVSAMFLVLLHSPSSVTFFSHCCMYMYVAYSCLWLWVFLYFFMYWKVSGILCALGTFPFFMLFVLLLLRLFLQLWDPHGLPLPCFSFSVYSRRCSLLPACKGLVVSLFNFFCHVFFSAVLCCLGCYVSISLILSEIAFPYAFLYISSCRSRILDSFLLCVCIYSYTVQFSC